MLARKAGKSVSLLSAQPTEIPGTKLKLPRQRALGLELGKIPGRINLARAGSLALPEGLPFSLVLSFGHQKKVQIPEK